MKKRNGLAREEGFHALLPRAAQFTDELLAAFQSESDHGLRCWLLELIGEARSEAAFQTLCAQSVSEDEAFSRWAIIGLENLDSPAAREFLFQHKLGRYAQR